MSPDSTHRTTSKAALAAVLIALLSGFGGLACGEKSPEELLQEATAELGKATQVKEAAKATLDQLDERLADAQAARETGFEAYQEAEARWTEANDAVGEFATDEVLHHQLNKSLLEEPGLKSSTIQARVNLRVATLVGNAGSQEAIDRAVEIAKGVPGVARVVSQVDLGPARRPDQVTPTREPEPAPVEEEAAAAPEPEPEPIDEPEPEAVEQEEPPAEGETAPDEEATAADEPNDEGTTEIPELEIPELTIPEGDWNPEADALPEIDPSEGGSVIERQI